MSIVQYPTKLRPYAFHGVAFYDIQGDNAPADCFQCGEQRNLNVNTHTGTYRCFECGESGNIYTFLRTLHEIALQQFQTNPVTDTLDILIQDKLLDPKLVKRIGIVPNPLTDDLIVPGRNSKGDICTLYKLIVTGNKWSCLCTPSCKSHPFLFPTNDQPLFYDRNVYICEGLWDTLALQEIFDDLGIPCTIMGIPGAGNFPDEFLPLLPENVVLLFDNDYPRIRESTKLYQPAWDGILAARSKILACRDSKVKYLTVLKWGSKGYHDKSLKDGYDVSDILRESNKDCTLAFSFLAKRFKNLSLGRSAIKEQPTNYKSKSYYSVVTTLDF